MLRHGRKEICGVSLAWVGEKSEPDLWISCKELKDRRLHHVENVEQRAKDLELRMRKSSSEEHLLFRKMGAGTFQRKSSLLHIDDVYILIESCQNFPHINLCSTTERKKKKSKQHRKKHSEDCDKLENQMSSHSDSAVGGSTPPAQDEHTAATLIENVLPEESDHTANIPEAAVNPPHTILPETALDSPKMFLKHEHLSNNLLNASSKIAHDCSVKTSPGTPYEESLNKSPAALPETYSQPVSSSLSETSLEFPSKSLLEGLDLPIGSIENVSKVEPITCLEILPLTSLGGTLQAPLKAKSRTLPEALLDDSLRITSKTLLNESIGYLIETESQESLEASSETSLKELEGPLKWTPEVAETPQVMSQSSMEVPLEVPSNAKSQETSTEFSSETQIVTPNTPEASPKSSTVVPIKSEKSFHLSATLAEKHETAIVRKLVRDAQKVAKKKQKFESQKNPSDPKSLSLATRSEYSPKVSQATTPISSTTSTSLGEFLDMKGRRSGPRIRTDTLKKPNLNISSKGLITFSLEVKEKVGLLTKKRREERERKREEKRELDELARIAKEILIEEKKRKTEETRLAKLAEKEMIQAEKEAKREAKLIEKNNSTRKSRRNGDKKSSTESPKCEKPRLLSVKLKSIGDKKKIKTRPMAPPPITASVGVPLPVLGCVTFLAGDKIIRRSPRKLPEAAVNAADPTTGVIPYSFACIIGNTQGVIPHGLSEKHFVSYRPAKKRASNHWCQELLQSLESNSGRDSGLDSAEEEAIRRLFSEKKRETKRKISRSPKKDFTELTPTKKLKKQSLSDGASSGDSGRETPTSTDVKEISIETVIPPRSEISKSEIVNMLDRRNLCIQAFCLTGYDYSIYE